MYSTSSCARRRSTRWNSDSPCHHGQPGDEEPANATKRPSSLAAMAGQEKLPAIHPQTRELAPRPFILRANSRCESPQASDHRRTSEPPTHHKSLQISAREPAKHAHSDERHRSN
jgi:hypothetical protein